MLGRSRETLLEQTGEIRKAQAQLELKLQGDVNGQQEVSTGNKRKTKKIVGLLLNKQGT